MSPFELREIVAPVDPSFHGMTFPAYRRLLDLKRATRHPEQGDSDEIDPIAIGAWHDGRPVGLILAEIPVVEQPSSSAESVRELIPQRFPQLLSVFVVERLRQRGLGNLLLQEMSRRIASLDLPVLSAVYTTGRPPIEHLERIFARQGWSDPRGRTLSVQIDLENALTSALLDPRRIKKLQHGLEIFPWSEVTTEELDALRRSNEKDPWIAPLLAPWRFMEQGFDSSSVGARYDGEIVGWVINHRVSLEAIRLTCSFIRRDLSRRGKILPLYDSVLRQFQGTPCQICTFITPLAYDGMIGFIRRRLAPIARSVQETRETEILLTGKITS